MATYYVRKDGNDGNDGSADSAAKAWLTVNKAVTTIAGGDIVYVGAGTYEETSGANYLAITVSTWATPVYIIGATGNPADVIIKAAADATAAAIYIGGAGANVSNLNISNVTVNARTGNSYAIRVLSATNLKLTNCIITSIGAAGSTYGIALIRTGVENIVSTTLESCNITNSSVGAGKSLGIYSAGGGVTGLSIINPNIYMTTPGASYGINILGGAGVQKITGGNVKSEQSVGIVIGADANPGYQTTGFVYNTTVSSASSHAILFGFTDNSGMYDSRIIGGDHGLVIKRSSAFKASGLDVTGGTAGAIIFKASTNSTVKYSNITQSNAIFAIGNYADAGVKCSGNNFSYNTVTTNNLGETFYWSPNAAADDSGTNVCDNNVYIHNHLSHFGDIWNTDDIPPRFHTLRAAWAAADQTSNDANSRVGILANSSRG